MTAVAEHFPEAGCGCGELHCGGANCGEVWPCSRVDDRARRHYTHTQWFTRTGHCGGCGGPADYCTCRPNVPCGCAHLHPMGSAYAPDALAKFTDTEQTALW